MEENRQKKDNWQNMDNRLKEDNRQTEDDSQKEDHRQKEDKVKVCIITVRAINKRYSQNEASAWFSTTV